MPASGVSESRTSVQWLNLLEPNVEANLIRMRIYYTKMAQRFKEEYVVDKSVKPSLDDWSEYKDDKDFIDELQKS